MKHYNKKFDKRIKPQLIKDGFILTRTKNGYKITKDDIIYFIHTGGSKCLKRLKRILVKKYGYSLYTKY